MTIGRTLMILILYQTWKMQQPSCYTILVFFLLWLFISCFSIQHPFCSKNLAWQQIFKKLNERWIFGSVIGGLKKNYAIVVLKSLFFCSVIFFLFYFFSFVKQEKYMWYCKKLKMWNFDCESEIKKKRSSIPEVLKSLKAFFVFVVSFLWGGVDEAVLEEPLSGVWKWPKSVIKIAWMEFVFH